MYQQTATGNQQPDSGILLMETGNCKGLTEKDTGQNGSKSTNTGNETSETGTANSLRNHCESTDKSTALFSCPETASKVLKSKDKTVASQPENTSVNTELAAAIVAINNLPLSAEEKAAIIRQLYNKAKG